MRPKVPFPTSGRIPPPDPPPRSTPTKPKPPGAPPGAPVQLGLPLALRGTVRLRLDGQTGLVRELWVVSLAVNGSPLLPDGWREEVRNPASGRVYRVYLGPEAGQIADSRVKAWEAFEVAATSAMDS